MSYINNFIIIDDDKINNKLCTKIIEKIYPDANITDFTEAQTGLDHIAGRFANPGNDQKAILLLDIMMPVMDAWGFLDEYEKLDDKIKSSIKIYILSSSVDKADMARANSNRYVEYYLIKPLTKESIKLLIHVLEKRLGTSRQ